MIKILRILNRFNVGGPTHNATYLTKYLEPKYTTKLIAGKKLDSEGGSEHMLKEQGVDYLILDDMSRSINIFKDLKTLFKIMKIIRKFKPDIVHTHASKSGALGRLAAILMKTPIIVHTFHGHVFHSYFGKLKTQIYIFIEKFLAKRSSAIIAISKLQKKELVEKFKICNPSKVSVIPLGFDLKRFQNNVVQNRSIFRQEFNLSDEELAIGIIGRLTPIKNHSFFIETVNELFKKTSKRVKVFIIGDGEDNEFLFELCNRLNLSYSYLPSKKIDYSAKIQFTSWRQDMEIIYAGLDIIALTSLNEGTPVTLIEAQAANKPIVTTNVGGILDVVIEGKTALISSNTVDEFSQKLLNLCEDSELRNKLGMNGYDHVKELFSYERLVYDMQQLYESL